VFELKFDIHEIITLLENMGVKDISCDDALLGFIMHETINQIKSHCNISAIPKNAKETVISIIIGKYLKSLKSVGKLELNALDFDAVPKSVSLGDTKVEFTGNDTTDEKRLDLLIDSWISSGLSSLNHFRKMAW
jgi:hypothetical protein